MNHLAINVTLINEYGSPVTAQFSGREDQVKNDYLDFIKERMEQIKSRGGLDELDGEGSRFVAAYVNFSDDSGEAVHYTQARLWELIYGTSPGADRETKKYWKSGKPYEQDVNW